MHHLLDPLEARGKSVREADLFSRLPRILRQAMFAPSYLQQLRGLDPDTVKDRAALATLPVLRKSDLPLLQKARPPFGGFVSGSVGS
jgi:phenylacetate-CoA ligase